MELFPVYCVSFEVGVCLKGKVHVITPLKDTIWTQKTPADTSKAC